MSGMVGRCRDSPWLLVVLPSRAGQLHVHDMVHRAGRRKRRDMYVCLGCLLPAHHICLVWGDGWPRRRRRPREKMGLHAMQQTLILQPCSVTRYLRAYIRVGNFGCEVSFFTSSVCKPQQLLRLFRLRSFPLLNSVFGIWRKRDVLFFFFFVFSSRPEFECRTAQGAPGQKFLLLFLVSPSAVLYFILFLTFFFFFFAVSLLCSLLFSWIYTYVYMCKCFFDLCLT